MNIIDKIKEFSKIYKEEVKLQYNSQLSSYKLLVNEIPNEIRNITKDLGSSLQVKGSIGQGNTTYYPWIGIFNPLVSSGATNGFYVVLLFSDDFEEIYLTLNQGSTVQSKQIIEQNRSFIYDVYNEIEGFIKGRIPERGLVKTKEYIPTNKGRQYEETNIFYKRYLISELSENVFIKDLKEIIDVYNKCSDKFKKEKETTQNHLIVVYVGKESEKNLRHGLENGIWGFKEKVINELKNRDNSDTYILLAKGYSGGSPRTSSDKWEKESLENIYIAKITSNFYKNTDVEWPDEIIMKEDERYNWRVNFTNPVSINKIKISELGMEISECLRKSAIAQSRGYLIENIDIDNILILGEKEMIKEQEFNYLSFSNSLEEINLKYSKELTLRFTASLLTKPFVLLTGLSGSGKTKLAQAFVKWLCKDESQYAIISVGANWTNRDPLLGYINALDTNNYIYPENECLKVLINASKLENQNKPYFLILDEMNLSHVERYFADFLSSMESGEDIKLHSTNNNEVPQKINISKNVFIIGTVNIDETTYMFSPKVLDRANVLEFKVTNGMMKEFLENPVKIDMQNIYSKGSLMNDDYMKKYLRSYSDFENREFIVKELLNFFNELKDLGAEYGFRTATEIFRFIAILRDLSPIIEVEKCIDYVIVQKLLPKVHGSRKRLQPILKKLGELCLIDNTSFEDYLSGKIELENIKYPVALEKINRMYIRLLNDGFTSFAEA